MALWLQLQNETCNGRIYYRLENQCSSEGIIHLLYHYIGQEKWKFFSFVTLVSRKCSKFSDHKFTLREQRIGTFKIIVDEIDRTDPSDQISPVSLVKYFKCHITPGGYSCFSGMYMVAKKQQNLIKHHGIMDLDQVSHSCYGVQRVVVCQTLFRDKATEFNNTVTL